MDNEYTVKADITTVHKATHFIPVYLHCQIVILDIKKETRNDNNEYKTTDLTTPISTQH